MATRNRSARTAATVQRLLEDGDGWSVIVVDDASTDGTSELLRTRFGPRVVVISLERNMGAAARTVGVRAARTELIAFSDDDSWWEAGALTIASRSFALQPDLAVLAASVVVHPEGRIDPIVEEYATSRLPMTPVGRSVLGFLACAAVVRRDAYLQVGGFHPLFVVGGEEELLALDLSAAGWMLAHVPDVVAHHQPEHGDAGRDGREVRMARNRLLVGWMRRPLPLVMAETARVAARALRDRRSREVLRELSAALPTALRERRRLPRTVERQVRQLNRNRSPVGAARGPSSGTATRRTG